MAHIKLNNENLPGIVGLLNYRPETAKPLLELAETLLRGNSTLTSGEREIIASSVSYQNDCYFCHTSHGAAAAAHLNADLDLIDDIKAGLPNTTISHKLKALLVIAHQVQQGGKQVTEAAIAAAFCMYNRYVDGLGTWAPEPQEAYQEMGVKMAKQGYLAS